MLIPKLTISVSRKIVSSSVFFVVAILAVFATASSSFAQGQQPVARLISNSVVNAASRPRRVAEFSATSSATIAGAPAVVAEANDIERTAFTKINEARVQNGLVPLAWDPVLCVMARKHSQEMAERNYFAHETPEGLEPKDRARALGILHFRVLAENIAYNKGFPDPGAFAAERWLLSGGHRANILYVGFQSSAVGTFTAADGSVYLTQVFITR